QLQQAFRESALLVIRDLALTPKSHIAFTRAFGDLVIHPLEFLRHRDYPEIIELSTSPAEPLAADDPSADENVAYSGWHTDLTLDPVAVSAGSCAPARFPRRAATPRTWMPPRSLVPCPARPEKACAA